MKKKRSVQCDPCLLVTVILWFKIADAGTDSWIQLFFLAKAGESAPAGSFLFPVPGPDRDPMQKGLIGHIVEFSTKSSSVQFSCSVVSESLRPRESQHARAPCPSPAAGVHSDSRPSSPWCHPAISSWVVFSSCPQSLPASESFPMSQLFSWGGQSTGVSALASFLPKKSQGWSLSEWIGWISL